MRKSLWFLILSMGVFLLSACGGGGGGATGGTGTLSVALTDASTDDYRAVYVTIKRVDVHRDGGGWETVSEPAKTYNLLELVNGVRESLGLKDLPAGHYTQMRLILDADPDNSRNILGHWHPYGNYFIDRSDNEVELKVPSGLQTGIKIVRGFTISPGGTTEIILDFDAARSIVQAGASGQWLLKPTIKVLETRELCRIEGSAGQGGVLVSAQVYEGSAAAAEDRVRVQAATVSEDNGSYVLLVPPGTYTLVGYKDGFSPYVKATKVVVEAGDVVTQNMTLTAADTGTLAGGPVTIAGGGAEDSATVSVRQETTVGGATEQIEVKAFNVVKDASFDSITLPVGDYTAVVSSAGKTAIVREFTIEEGTETDIGAIAF